jgi:regulator of replication initiation timing
MSDTPRTDAEQISNAKKHSGGVVSIDFARTLERELAEARKELGDSINRQNALAESNVNLIRECNHLRDRLTDLERAGSAMAKILGFVTQDESDALNQALTAWQQLTKPNQSSST